MYTPQKHLGQNFLRCEWVTDTMVRTAHLASDDTVLEIGAGEGALTRALALQAKRIIAIEKDPVLAEGLRERLAKERITNVEIIHGDILKILPSFFTDYHLQTTNYKLISNIPYYLTSRLLRDVLTMRPLPESVTLLIQKEVAERITARPPRMNILALSVQAYGTPEIVKKVPNTCFFPKPKVDSAIIHISNLSDTFFTDNNIGEEKFFAVLKKAFSQKRKLLSNTLKDITDHHFLRELFSACDLSDKIRAENLSLAQWAQIVQKL